MNINCWIIYPRYVSLHSDNAFGWLTEEAARKGVSLTVVFAEDLTTAQGDGGYTLFREGRQEDKLPQVVIMRTYERELSSFFESAGVAVINGTNAMELCKNKVLTHQMLTKAGIPTPLTVYRRDADYSYPMLAGLFGSGEFIVKRTDGAKGENVYLVGSGAEMEKAIRECGSECLCQRFVTTSRGRDVRVWVIGGRVAGAVLRHSASSFISNYSQGGNVSPFTVDEATEKLCLRVAELSGLDFAGIDLLFTTEGFTVCEVNGNAGFRTLSKTGENPIPEMLFAHIRDKYGSK